MPSVSSPMRLEARTSPRCRRSVTDAALTSCTGVPEMFETLSGEAPETMSSATLACTSQVSPMRALPHSTGSTTFMSPRSL